MAALPDPYDKLSEAEREAWDHMADARARSDGRSKLGEVYVAMFNNPGVAEKVGALGEHLRFGGVLPGAVRELAILRYSAINKLGYEWAHHQRPAKLAGLSDEAIEALGAGETPVGLSTEQEAVIKAVDSVSAFSPIPEDVQSTIIDAFGLAGAVEVVALCGLYATMGYMVSAFEIPIEEGFPRPPF